MGEIMNKYDRIKIQKDFGKIQKVAEPPDWKQAET